MNSPFPGMASYTEVHWLDVQTRLIVHEGHDTECADTLLRAAGRRK